MGRPRVRYPQGLYVANIPYNLTVLSITPNGVFELGGWSDGKAYFTEVSLLRFKKLINDSIDDLIPLRKIEYTSRS